MEDRRGSGTEPWGPSVFQAREMRKGETITGLHFLLGVVIPHLGGYIFYMVCVILFLRELQCS